MIVSIIKDLRENNSKDLNLNENGSFDAIEAT